MDDGVLLYAYAGCVFRVPDGVQPPKAGSRFFCRHLHTRAGERVHPGDTIRLRLGAD